MQRVSSQPEQRSRPARRPFGRGGVIYRVDDLGIMAPEPVPVDPPRRALSPEQALAVAVLEQALEDIEQARAVCPGPLPPSYSDRRNREKITRRGIDADDALRWILGQPLEVGDGFTFEACCEAAGFDPEAVRAAICRRAA